MEREVQEGAGVLLTSELEDRQGVRDVCVLEQLLAERQVNLDQFLTLLWCYFAFLSFVKASTSVCVLILVLKVLHTYTGVFSECVPVSPQAD